LQTSAKSKLKVRKRNGSNREEGKMEGIHTVDSRSAGRTAPKGNGIPELESFPSVNEKKTQWLAANRRLIALEEKIKRIKEERQKIELGLKSSTPADLEERARASLRGEGVAIAGPKEDLSALYEERQVLQTAVSIAKNSFDEAVGEASVEVCKQFSAECKARAKKIALCAIALSEAIGAKEELCFEIRAQGFRLTEPIVSLPTLFIKLGSPRDQNSPLFAFLKALRAKGIEV
jgi:hypothetical protein